VRYLLVLLLLAGVAAGGFLVYDRRVAPAEPREQAAVEPAAPERPRDFARLRCPDDVSGCRSVRGTVVYVERVDPDGDGDLHVVVDSGSIPLPGMTAVDVAPELRPRRDPSVGDRVSAAGPVQTGSYGQSQIHALDFRARRRG
jgi:hypothetical protein